MERRSPAPNTTTKPIAWRTPMACQQCRRRKIKCDAALPCKNCQQRDIECVYRDVPRPQRKRKAQATTAARNQHELHNDNVPYEFKETSANPYTGTPADGQGGPARGVFYSSVAASHIASPSCVVHLYYGPSSNFSMMQQIYRHRTTGSTSEAQGREEVEEAGPGLDLFSFRRLFFGDMDGSHDKSKTPPDKHAPMFISYSLASMFLERYLLTVYQLSPFISKKAFMELLDNLYHGADNSLSESGQIIVLLLAMAIGASMTDHGPLAESLFQKAKHDAEPLDDVVNLQTVQIPLLMISCHE